MRTPRPVPGALEPKDFVPYLRDGRQFVEAGTASMLIPDLRFSEAILLVLDAKQPGKMKIAAEGLFRYCDRKPCWQAQWEDIIELREKLVPNERRPMEFEVRLDGRTVGKLVPVKTETREVPLEMASPTAGLKPKTAMEAVVTELSGPLDLPPGRHELLLIHRNMVDGKLSRVTISRP